MRVTLELTWIVAVILAVILCGVDYSDFNREELIRYVGLFSIDISLICIIYAILVKKNFNEK